jgi:signal transduction histidine kinase
LLDLPKLSQKAARLMKRNLTQLIAALDRLVNYFIPPDIMADREACKRAHVFLISHILGPFIGSVVPGTIYFIDPKPGYEVAILAISIVAFWVFPFLLKARVPYNPLALVSVQNLIFCILWSCYFYGGVTSPTLAWVLTIPLLAFFYLGSSASLRMIVIGMFVVNLAIFSGFYFYGYHPTTDNLPKEAMQGLGLISTIAAALYVAMMALYYAKVQTSQGELESEMRQHMATASALRLATVETERAGAAKAEFLAKMSHELRTPLNAVIGYSQILIEDAQDEGDAESIEDLGKILGAGRHLLKLVNEILDLSKIEAGKMELDLQETVLADLLNEIATEAEPAAVANGNTIACKIDPDLGNPFCDAVKLRNVLAQLVDNAVKFTQDGRVELVAERMPGDAADQLVLHVIDTGIGIDPDQISSLFEKFTVIDDSSTSKYGGTGLGLALSQKFCRLMGGDILVESKIGQGSRFTVRIPFSYGAGTNSTVGSNDNLRAGGQADIHAAATLAPGLQSPELSLPSTMATDHA